MLLRYVYVVFIGVLLSLFVGVGIAAFYPSPKSPDYNSYPTPIAQPLPASESAKILEQNQKQQDEQKAYQLVSQEYNKNVAIISIIAAIIILVLSLIFAKLLTIISDGLLLGALLTLVYAIIRSFGTEDFKFMFIVVAVGLVITMYLGYSKFIKK